MILETSDLKTYIGVDTRDTVNDDKYTQSLVWAESVLYQHRCIGARATVTEEKHDPSAIVIPKLLPLYSVTSLYLEDIEQTEDEDYFVYPYYVKIPYLNATEPKSIKLTYVGGVASDDTETEFIQAYYAAKQAILKLAAYDCQKDDTYNGGKDLDLYETINQIMRQVPGALII